MDNDRPMDFGRVAAKGTFWAYASRYSGKFVALVSTFILARLLTKDDFGVVGYALVVTNFLDVVQDLGVGSAIVYRKEEPKASDTAFWLLLFVGIALFAITWIIAPLVGDFFKDARAIPVTRALALTFPIGALGTVHGMLLDKSLAFDRSFIPEIARSIGKGVLSVLFALLNFRVWSLVLGNVGGIVVMTIAYWLVFPWRPSFNFDRNIARELLTYGTGILSVNILAFFLRDTDSILVGRYLGAEALGIYSLAYRVPDILVISFCRVISRVTFPVYVKMRDIPGGLTEGFLKAQKYITYFTIPAGVGLALVARPFVLTFFTEKWIEAIPVFQAISIYAMLFSFSYNAGSVYKAQGQPFVLTKLALMRFALLLPALYFTVTKIGTLASIGWVHACVALVAGTINLIVAGRMMDVTLWRMLLELRPVIVAGLSMLVGVWGVLFMCRSCAPLLQLTLGVASGAIVFLPVLGLQQREEAAQVLGFVKTTLRRD